MKWSTSNIPSQKGRIVVVTGANSGLGFHTSRALALKGARVIMACRNIQKGEEARQRILNEEPDLEPEVWMLNLADLASVKAFYEKFTTTFHRLDLLINNAGLMAIPYEKSEDGFEMQFGVNHLGHFSLTAQLWPLIRESAGARIVNVSSAAHHLGRIRFDDIHWEKKYSKWGAYGMSKLSNLLFTKELSRRFSRSGETVIVASSHPGYANTALHTKGALMKGSKLGVRSFRLANRIIAQPAFMGALPSLYAATAEGVDQGAYFGPGGFMRMKGWPAPDYPNSKRVTDEVARQLWDLSESLTGLKFAV